jgi:predicted Zn-dependent peptidase
MTLAVVGNFSKSEVKTSIQKYFVINSAKKSINVTQQWVLPRKIFHTKLESFDALQVQMLCGFVTGISFSHKDRYIMQLITEILSGGVSARIFQKLVYELGIAYSVGAYDMQLNDTGIFFISGGVARENVDEAMKVIGDEIYNLRTIELTDEELLMAKERAITKFSFLAEKTDDLAGLYVIQQMREGKTFSIKELTENLMKVNSVDIKRVAQKYLCYSNLYIMLCGPVKKDGVKFINGMFDKLQ